MDLHRFKFRITLVRDTAKREGELECFTFGASAFSVALAKDRVLGFINSNFPKMDIEEIQLFEVEV